MIALKNDRATEEFVVIHPLFDVQEEKRTGDGLGCMHISKGVKISLMALRLYLVVMSVLLVYHLMDQVGVFGHAVGK